MLNFQEVIIKFLALCKNNKILNLNFRILYVILEEYLNEQNLIFFSVGGQIPTDWLYCHTLQVFNGRGIHALEDKTMKKYLLHNK